MSEDEKSVPPGVESGRPAEQPGLPLIRCGIGGVLMGLANLVPGVSGGTMILITGLYDDFISAIADATRFKFTRRGTVFLGIIALTAAVTILSLAGPLARLVLLHPVAMYSLFIGMTLGGVPLLWRMMQPISLRSALCTAAGLGLMIGIAAAKTDHPEPSRDDQEQIKRTVQGGEFSLQRAYGRDLAAGLLGMSAMVLPGISGAYMLLLLGRYEQILSAISLTKDWALSGGKSGDLAALHVIVPVAIGAIISLVGVTNILKWLLHHHARPTVAFLLGILAGSAVMLWLHAQVKGPSEYAQAGPALLIGLAVTLAIAHLGAGRTPSTPQADHNRGP